MPLEPKKTVSHKTSEKNVQKFLNANLILLLQGQFVSQTGSQLFAIASFFWIKHATGSASLLGLMMMVLALPAVLLGPIAGTVADRYSRRSIIIVCDLLDGVVMLGLFALATLAPQAQSALLAALFGVTLFIGTVGTFFRPAISAAVPDLVPEDKVAPANSLFQGSLQLAMFVGQGLGGVLYRLLGAPLLFLANGISYLVSAGSELFIQIPQQAVERASGWKESVRAVKADTVLGFRYAWDRVGMRTLFLYATFQNFFMMPIITLLPFYVENHLGARTDWYGYLIAAFGAGTLVGNLAAGVLRLRPERRRDLLLLSFLLFDGIQIVLAATGTPAGALAVVTLAGLFQGFGNIHIVTILQLTTPSQVRGRVFGLLATLSGAAAPLGMALAGFAADLTGQNVPAIFATCGAIQLLATAGVVLIRPFREFLAYEPAGTSPSDLGSPPPGGA